MFKITVTDTTRGETLAEATLKDGVIEFEGNMYFDPDRVNMDHLIITDRVYHCSYKGDAFWIDLDAPDGVIRNVAWVYPAPMRGYGHIKDKLGFSDGERPGICTDKRFAATGPLDA